MLRSNSKSLGNHVVNPEEEKESCSGKDLHKRKKSGMKDCTSYSLAAAKLQRLVLGLFSTHAF